MKPRLVLRWRTRFGVFVSDYTVSRLVAALGGEGEPVTPRAVYHWLGGIAPRPAIAEAIARISAGRVTIADVYRHRREVATNGRDYEKQSKGSRGA